MKARCLLILLLFTVGSLVFAQGIESIEKGTRFLGGEFSLSHSNRTENSASTSSETNSRSFYIGPVFGKYFKENLAWGVSAHYGFGSHNFSNSTTKSQYAGAGFFLTRNFKVASNLFFEIEPRGRISFGTDRMESSGGNVTYNSLSGGIGATAGLLFFLGPRFGIQTSFGYIGYNFSRYSREESEHVATSHTVNAGAGLSNISFSMRYFFP
jgi:hypothetical protein